MLCKICIEKEPMIDIKLWNKYCYSENGKYTFQLN